MDDKLRSTLSKLTEHQLPNLSIIPDIKHHPLRRSFRERNPLILEITSRAARDRFQEPDMCVTVIACPLYTQCQPYKSWLFATWQKMEIPLAAAL